MFYITRKGKVRQLKINIGGIQECIERHGSFASLELANKYLLRMEKENSWFEIFAPLFKVGKVKLTSLSSKKNTFTRIKY